jgi:hypothetical protein
MSSTLSLQEIAQSNSSSIALEPAKAKTNLLDLEINLALSDVIRLQKYWISCLEKKLEKENNPGASSPSTMRSKGPPIAPLLPKGGRPIQSTAVSRFISDSDEEIDTQQTNFIAHPTTAVTSNSLSPAGADDNAMVAVPNFNK